ncbi:MAG: hypothetical protein ACPGII_03750 [Opitutales bacterium]
MPDDLQLFDFFLNPHTRKAKLQIMSEMERKPVIPCEISQKIEKEIANANKRFNPGK